ncbi:MAG: MATE family efflux transporter [Clostridia bacterium]|nr:MATE family efflux transporter [Clostridia bacterium]
MEKPVFWKKYIGDRAFYRRLLSVMLPVLVQNVITNFVSLLDNIMVGRIGTESMSGVAIVNQLLFVFNLCIFGGLSGAGIFTAQFFGRGDSDGVRHTVRLKCYIALIATALFGTVFLLFGEPLIALFLHEGEVGLDLMATLHYGQEYLWVMLLQMLPFAIMQVYASTLRECGETLLPMKAGIAAIFINLGLNYILIFGKLGLPALGVVGAAIATVIARLIECAIVVLWAHRHTKQHPYITGLYRSLRVPVPLLKKVAIKGMPLLINEVLWSSGMTTLNQCYSLRGLEVVSAINISSTVSNLFFCAFFATGSTIAILIGQLLGAGELDRAVDEDRKLLAFAVALSAVVGAIMALCAPLIPALYNTQEQVRQLATQFLLVVAALMPFHAFTNGSYFTLRSGGKTLITFLFDSAFIWVVNVPVAMALTHLSTLPILAIYAAVQCLELVKVVLGTILLKRRAWVNNLVETI